VLSYQYKAATADGATITGTLTGDSRDDVANQLQVLGHIPIRINEAREPEQKQSLLRIVRRQRISDEQIADFTRDLSTLLRAGISLDKAMAMLCSLNSSTPFARIMKQVLDRIRDGMMLADAIQQHEQVFGQLYVNMLRAGESSGALEPVLLRLSEYLAKNRQTRDALVSALIYPAILVVVALASVFTLLGYVVPQFADMFASAGEALPMSTQMTIATGEFLRTYGPLIAALILAVIVITRRQLRDPSRRLMWHRTLLKLPFAGRIALQIEVARFSRTLATLLENGVPLLGALAIVKNTISNLVIAGGIETVSTRLKEGQSLAAPLARHTPIPAFALHMIQVGEETGNLQDILVQIADAYDRITETALKRALALLEPALILVLGSVIAAVIISILVAILSVNELVI